MSPTKASDKQNKSIVWNHLYGDTTEPHKPIFKLVIVFEYTRKRPPLKKDTPNWTKEISEIVDIQNTNPVTCKVKDLNGEPVDGSFYEPELQKATQDVFRIEKVIQRRVNEHSSNGKDIPIHSTVVWTTSPLLDEIYVGLPQLLVFNYSFLSDERTLLGLLCKTHTCEYLG